jgi:hypothetical protein
MLPVNGRNFIDFVLTTPGVTRDVRLGDISFAGQRGTLNSLVVDGADNNNTFFGQALGRTGSGRAPYQFSQDAVAEFQVNRNAYSAEYGRAGGAVINVVTKSGSNDYHGSLFEFYRDKSLNENSWANKTAVPARPKSPYGFDQFGGSLRVTDPARQGLLLHFLRRPAQRDSQRRHPQRQPRRADVADRRGDPGRAGQPAPAGQFLDARPEPGRPAGARRLAAVAAAPAHRALQPAGVHRHQLRERRRHQRRAAHRRQPGQHRHHQPHAEFGPLGQPLQRSPWPVGQDRPGFSNPGPGESARAAARC